MDREKNHCQDYGLGPIADQSSRLHGRIVTASARDKVVTVSDQTRPILIPTPCLRTPYPSTYERGSSTRPHVPCIIDPLAGLEVQRIYRDRSSIPYPSTAHVEEEQYQGKDKGEVEDEGEEGDDQTEDDAKYSDQDQEVQVEGLNILSMTIWDVLVKGKEILSMTIWDVRVLELQLQRRRIRGLHIVLGHRASRIRTYIRIVRQSFKGRNWIDLWMFDTYTGMNLFRLPDIWPIAISFPSWAAACALFISWDYDLKGSRSNKKIPEVNGRDAG
ncbi:hypothetical protein M9H77_22759 [Catharanthus roseus]|uniref:Uncharacterized protein n=1 Tax=Catharanthus roseus TaxID=4058 RepID=A0ACC0AVF1_CATRO|nr:hypothetical protein M9H77_22759 [Catharanthus roseus]